MLSRRYCSGFFIPNYSKTIEDELSKELTIMDYHLKANVLDTAGQEEYAAFRYTWVTGRDAFILAFSVENPCLEIVDR
jgi:GTPase SAR1 family protein